MRLSDLIRNLETLQGELAALTDDTDPDPDPDPEVTITIQQSWPLESHIRGVALLLSPTTEDTRGNPTATSDPRITLVEGPQIGYGTPSVFDPSEHLA